MITLLLGTFHSPMPRPFTNSTSITSVNDVSAVKKAIGSEVATTTTNPNTANGRDPKRSESWPEACAAIPIPNEIRNSTPARGTLLETTQADQVDRHEEARRRRAHEAQQSGEDRQAEHRVAEQAQLDHRRGAAQLPADERSKQQGTTASPPRISGETQLTASGLLITSHEQDDRQRREHGAAPVEGRPCLVPELVQASLVEEHVAGHERDRDRDDEHEEQRLHGST